ncbi:hypothetical protein FIBSPDRAFT_850701 [Athelia psychrophila]|uniref:Uncharacterized protein n=1 Tax=Athelia psychrophila TaxID=1759441 RepID=A0A166TAY1_9AGAM|nr:hypothetical protein FIBSPDRAFT_850701 [Fibularhizoctonia sp. CBS 109695]
MAGARGDGLARNGAEPHPLTANVRAASTRAADGAAPGVRGRALARSGGAAGCTYRATSTLFSIHPLLSLSSIPTLSFTSFVGVRDWDARLVLRSGGGEDTGSG